MNPNPDPLEWVWRRVRSHPPRCLAGVVALRDTDATRVADARFPAEASVLWEIAHPDRTQRPKLFGHFMRKRWPPESAPLRGLILLSPLTIRWLPSGEETLIFDGSRHGYNPELGGYRVHAVGSLGHVPWMNLDGPATEPVYVAAFCYDWLPGDELSGEMTARPEDFFGWYTLLEVDRATNRVTPVTEFECA